MSVLTGGLSLAIEGPSKTEIKCVDNGDGTCTVTYLPTAPGEYNITVKFADKHISGSPFVAKVTRKYCGFACTVKILKRRTPEKFAVITLKFEQGGFTTE